MIYPEQGVRKRELLFNSLSNLSGSVLDRKTDVDTHISLKTPCLVKNSSIRTNLTV